MKTGYVHVYGSRLRDQWYIAQRGGCALHTKKDSDNILLAGQKGYFPRTLYRIKVTYKAGCYHGR